MVKRLWCMSISGLMLMSGCTSVSNTKETFKSAQVLKIKNDYKVSIIYPTSSNTLFQKEIDKYIQNEQKSFTKNTNTIAEAQHELNIFYQERAREDRYRSFIFKSYVQSNTSISKIKSFVWDNREQCFVDLKAIFDVKKINKLANLIQTKVSRLDNRLKMQDILAKISPSIDNYSNFSIDASGIVFHFDQSVISTHCQSIKVFFSELADEFKMQEIDEPREKIDYDFLQIPKRIIDNNKPMVALTFDDGPHPRFTQPILDTLRENQSNATFFILGTHANRAPEVLRNMVRDGNEIGNHGFSHKQMTTLSVNALKAEINNTQKVIEKITNVAPLLLRPPYGSKNEQVLNNAKHFKVVTWSVDTRDWSNQNAQSIVNHVMNNVKDGDIILMHDIFKSSTQAAIILIPKLIDEGYQLVTISQLYDSGKNNQGKIIIP